MGPKVNCNGDLKESVCLAATALLETENAQLELEIDMVLPMARSVLVSGSQQGCCEFEGVLVLEEEKAPLLYPQAEGVKTKD